MASLHTVNRSPYGSDALDACLRHLQAGDGVLLFEDGVYAAVPAVAKARTTAAPDGCRWFVLDADCRARGVDTSDLAGEMMAVDYKGFVQLVCEYDRVVPWS